MVDAIRQAKAGRRGDPLVLLREGSSLLPPQNYNLRQYQAPPSWELAGTGGYHPQENRASRAQADTSACVPGVTSGTTDGGGAAADTDGRYPGRKDGYRQMLDDQIREKQLRVSYEQHKMAEENRAAHRNPLPSYLNSNRGGGGDAMRKDYDFAGNIPDAAEQGSVGSVHQHQSPNAHHAHAEYGGLRFQSIAPAPPLHGRRSHHNLDDDVTGSNANVLSSIDEEKTIEQKLYEPTSPQHARFRLSYADPETQAAMLKKEQERKAMREILAAQIAEKEERRQVTLREGRKRDAAEYQREQRYHSANEQRSSRGVRSEEHPQASYSHGSQQQQQQQQQQQDPQQPAPDDPEQPDSWQEQHPGVGGHGAPPNADTYAPPVNAVLGFGNEAIASSRGGVSSSASGYQPANLGLGRTNGSQRSDSDAGLCNLHSTTNSNGSEKYSGVPNEWGTAELFGGAAHHDSLDELKSLCKDLLVEQQGLRAQLANQSNVVSALRIAASGRERGQASRAAAGQHEGQSRHTAGGGSSSAPSRVPQRRPIAHSSRQHQHAANRFGQVDAAVQERRGVEARPWDARQPHNSVVVDNPSGRPQMGKQAEPAHPQWLHQEPQDTRGVPTQLGSAPQSVPKSPPIPTHRAKDSSVSTEATDVAKRGRPTAKGSFADKFRAPAAGRRARKQPLIIGQKPTGSAEDTPQEQGRRNTPEIIMQQLNTVAV
eukprot:COSAG05_NODE_980_length_6311_cov_21.873632_6_plen_711_part_00